MQRLRSTALAHRTCDLHHIAVIQCLAMNVYGLQVAVPRLGRRYRLSADPSLEVIGPP